MQVISNGQSFDDLLRLGDMEVAAKSLYDSYCTVSVCVCVCTFVYVSVVVRASNSLSSCRVQCELEIRSSRDVPKTQSLRHVVWECHSMIAGQQSTKE